MYRVQFNKSYVMYYKWQCHTYWRYEHVSQ